jgi:hypothetical protein
MLLSAVVKAKDLEILAADLPKLSLTTCGVTCWECFITAKLSRTLGAARRALHCSYDRPQR